MVQTRRSLESELKSRLRKGRNLAPEKKKKILLKRFREAQEDMKNSIMKRKQRQQEKKIVCLSKSKKIKKKVNKTSKKRKRIKRKPLKCMDLIESISKTIKKPLKKIKKNRKITKKINKNKKTKKATRTQSAKKSTIIKAKKRRRTSMSEQKKIKTSLKKRNPKIRKKKVLFKDEKKESLKLEEKIPLSPVKEKSDIEEESKSTPVLSLMDLIPFRPERNVVAKPDKSAGYTGAGEEIREETEEESEPSIHETNPNLLGFHDLLKSFTNPAPRKSSVDSEISSARSHVSENKDNLSFRKDSFQMDKYIDEQKISENENLSQVFEDEPKENNEYSNEQFEEFKSDKLMHSDLLPIEENVEKINEEVLEAPIRKKSLNIPELNCEQIKKHTSVVNQIINPVVQLDKIVEKENINNVSVEKEDIIKTLPINEVNNVNSILEETNSKTQEKENNGIEIEEENNEILQDDISFKNIKCESPVKKQPEKIWENKIIEEMLITPKKKSKVLSKSASKTKQKRLSSTKTVTIKPILEKSTIKQMKKNEVNFLATKIMSTLDCFKNKKSKIKPSTINFVSIPSFDSSNKISMKEKYQDFLAPRIITTLSSSLKRMLSKFNILSINVNIFLTNRQTPFFTTLRESIYSNYKELINLQDLQKMLHVLKFCFHVEWAYNVKIEDYDLVLTFPKEILDSGSKALNSHRIQQMHSTQENSCPNTKIASRSLGKNALSDHLTNFRKKLVSFVGIFHNKFLDDNKIQGSSFEGEFSKTWHYKFKLETITELKLKNAMLPPKPKKVSLEEIRREKLHQVLGSSAREKMEEIEKKIKNLQKECLKQLDSRENTYIFNDFEREKYINCSATEESSHSKQLSIETVKKIVQWQVPQPHKITFLIL
mgnify:CR=1 FL=1